MERGGLAGLDCCLSFDPFDGLQLGVLFVLTDVFCRWPRLKLPHYCEGLRPRLEKSFNQTLQTGHTRSIPSVISR